ncbi:MAG: OmpA family protein [Alphaproteobacteria bacterium]
MSWGVDTMIASLRPVTAAVAVALATLALAPDAAANCAAIHAEAERATAAGDVAGVAALHDRSLTTADCDDGFRRALGRRAARLMVEEAQKLAARPGGQAAARTMLRDSLTHGRLWQALAMLGDMAQAERDWAEATQRFQEALNEIGDPASTPTPPPAQMVELVFRKAEAARLLAPDYVAAPRTRDGTPGGLGAANVRGFVPTKVAIPVTFDFDSTNFDAKGQAAARELLEQLRAQGEPAITLNGHTDPKGTAEYNLTLSERRANAVRSFLVQNGYKGRVTVQAFGKSRPFEPDDPGRYSTEERHRMDRRVELVR